MNAAVSGQELQEAQKNIEEFTIIAVGADRKFRDGFHIQAPNSNQGEDASRLSEFDRAMTCGLWKQYENFETAEEAKENVPGKAESQSQAIELATLIAPTRPMRTLRA